MQITTKLSIKDESTSSFGSSTGIIFHDFFLDKSTFISLYKEYYLEKKQEIDITVNNLLLLLSQYNAKVVNHAMASQFQKLWEEFQLKVLMNKQPLQLLVVYRGDGTGKQSEYSAIVNQAQVEESIDTKYGHRYGINTGNSLIEDSMRVIQARNVEEFLRIHMTGLLNQLYSTIGRNVAEALHDYHSDILNHIYTTSDRSKRQHITGQKWYKVVYGEMPFTSWQGNAYEAFFNHMANHEPNLFNYLSNHGQNMAAMLNFKTQKNSVYAEEGGYQQDLGNFPRLMMGQINSIPWFAGGDIVIVNNKMEVIYNIQLKTTTRNTQTVFAEKVSELRNFLTKFVSVQTVEEKAELLFNSFQNTIANSSMVNNLEKNAEQEAIEIIKQSIYAANT